MGKKRKADEAEIAEVDIPFASSRTGLATVKVRPDETDLVENPYHFDSDRRKS